MGSSSSISSGSITRARASAVRFFCPPDSSSTRACGGRRSRESTISTRDLTRHPSPDSSWWPSCSRRSISASSWRVSSSCATRSYSPEHALHLAQALGRGLEDCLSRSELRFLRDMREPQLRHAPDHAVVGRSGPGDDAQQAALAGAVAADQRDLVAGVEAEVDVIEQRDVTVRKADGFEGQEGHRLVGCGMQVRCWRVTAQGIALLGATAAMQVRPRV